MTSSWQSCGDFHFSVKRCRKTEVMAKLWVKIEGHVFYGSQCRKRTELLFEYEKAEKYNQRSFRNYTKITKLYKKLQNVDQDDMI